MFLVLGGGRGVEATRKALQKGSKPGCCCISLSSNQQGIKQFKLDQIRKQQKLKAPPIGLEIHIWGPGSGAGTLLRLCLARCELPGDPGTPWGAGEKHPGSSE